MGKQAGPIQQQSSAPPRTRTTCSRNRSTTTAGAGLQTEQRSLARSWIGTLGKSNRACCSARFGVLRGSARAEKLRRPINSSAMSRRAGLSTIATATIPSSNFANWQIGLRCAKWRAPRLAKGGDIAAGGSRRKLSFLPRGSGSGDTALVYGLVAVSFWSGTVTFGWCTYRTPTVVLCVDPTIILACTLGTAVHDDGSSKTPQQNVSVTNAECK